MSIGKAGPLRIVIATLHYYPDYPSGSARLAYDEARFWAAQGHEVWVLTQDISRTRPAYSVEEGLHVLRYPSPNLPPLDLRRLWAHSQLIRRALAPLQGTVDLVHGHTPLEYAGVLAVYPQARRGYSIHSPVRLETLATARDLPLLGRLRAQALGTLHHRLERRVLETSQVITADSEFTRQQIAQTHNRALGNRVQVVPGWVDTTRFQIASDREALKRQLGWPLDRPVLFTLRRLVPRMGLDRLLHALRLVKAAGCDCYLALGGRGPLRERLEALTAELELSDRVRFLGFVTDADLPAMYAAADAFVLPTAELECFGVIALEALACGRPVLATPVGAIPEIVARFEPRWLAQDATPPAIAALLLAYLRGTLPAHDPAALRQTVLQHYDQTHVLQRLTTLLLGEPGI